MPPWADIERSIYRTPGCWLWVPSRFQGVYKATPKIKIGGYLHRVSHVVWQHYERPLEGVEYLRRTCSEVNCVRPSHHKCQSHLLADYGMGAINAVATHCVSSHPLAGSNLYVSPGGQRKCRKCMKNRRAEQRNAVDRVRLIEGVRRPTRGELARRLSAGNSYEKLGREYGVTGRTVNNWARKWDLTSDCAAKR